MKKDDIENYYEEEFEILTPPNVIDEEDRITTSLSLHSVNSREKLKTPKKPSFLICIRSQSANASRKRKHITPPTTTEKLLKDINMALDYKMKEKNDFLKESKNLRILIRKMNEDFKKYIEKNKEELMGIAKKKNEVNVDRFLLDKEKWNNKTILINLKKEEDKLKEFYKRISQKNYEKNLEALISKKKEEIKNLRRENADLKKATQNQSKIISNPKLLFYPKKKTKDLEEIIYNIENGNKELFDKIKLKEEKLKSLNDKEKEMGEKFEKVEKIAAFYKIEETYEKEELLLKFSAVQRQIEQKEKIISFYRKNNYRNEIKNLKGEILNLDKKVDKIVGEVILQKIEIKSKTKEEPLNFEENSFQVTFFDLKNEEMIKLGLKIGKEKINQKANKLDISNTQEIQVISNKNKTKEKHFHEFDKKEEAILNNEIKKELMTEDNNSKLNNKEEDIKLHDLKEFHENSDKTEINQAQNYENKLNVNPPEKPIEHNENGHINLKQEQSIFNQEEEKKKQPFSFEKLNQVISIEEIPLLPTFEKPNQRADEPKRDEIKLSSRKSIKNETTPKTTASQKMEERNILDFEFTPTKMDSSKKNNSNNSFNFINVGQNAMKEPKFFNFSRNKKNPDLFNSELSENNEINVISSEKKEVNLPKDKENNEETTTGYSRRKKKLISNLDPKDNNDYNSNNNFMQDSSYIDRKMDNISTNTEKISSDRKNDISQENFFFDKKIEKNFFEGKSEQTNFKNISEKKNEVDNIELNLEKNEFKATFNKKREATLIKEENNKNDNNTTINKKFEVYNEKEGKGNFERKYEISDPESNQKKKREIKLFEDDEEHFMKEKEIKLDDEWGKVNRNGNKRNVVNSSNKDDNFNFFSDFKL